MRIFFSHTNLWQKTLFDIKGRAYNFFTRLLIHLFLVLSQRPHWECSNSSSFCCWTTGCSTFERPYSFLYKIIYSSQPHCTVRTPLTSQRNFSWGREIVSNFKTLLPQHPVTSQPLFCWDLSFCTYWNGTSGIKNKCSRNRKSPNIRLSIMIFLIKTPFSNCPQGG